MSGEFSPRSFRPGGARVITVSKLSSPTDTIEPFRSALTAVLVFPLVDKPADCLREVRLRLRETLMDNRPRGLADVPLDPGWAEAGDFVRRFGGAAAGGNAPQLAWTASGDCPG
jgi:hypothetical protein